MRRVMTVEKMLCLLCLQASYVPTRAAIAVAFRDNSVMVWDSITYEVKARLRLPEQHDSCNVECFSTTSDGVYLIAGTRTGSLLLWELASEARHLQCSAAPVCVASTVLRSCSVSIVRLV